MKYLLTLFLTVLVALPAAGQTIVKVSALPSGSAPSGSELIPAVQGGVTVSLTAAQMKSYIQQGMVAATLTVNGHALSGNVTVTPTDLALVIGTNVEAWNMKLDALAALAAPGTTGYVLASTTGGVLSWVPQVGAGALTIGSNASGVLTISSGVLNFANPSNGANGLLVLDGTGNLPAGMLSNYIGSTVQTFNAALTAISNNSGTVNLSGVTLTAPTLTTPVLGAATATSVNGLTLTTSTGTLSIANGKTGTFSNTLTLAGTDGSTLNVGTGGTLGANAFTSTVYVPQTTTVNGHALSGNIVVSASDLTTGTLPIGQVPTGTTSSTVAIGNDTRFPANVTGIRLGAGAGSTDTALTIGSGLTLSGGTLTASGSGGTVTSVSAGNLPPLFTTSVATSTSTPALTFALSNAAQNSVFAGPASGGSGAPSFQTAPTISAANMTSFPTLNQNTTGNAATATKATQDASGNVITTTYAPLASAPLTGIPTAPTASAGTNTTQLATTQYVLGILGQNETITGNWNLGTPSAVVLTNGTGLPISTGVSGLGTGVAAAAALAPNSTTTTGSLATYSAQTQPLLSGGGLSPSASGNSNLLALRNSYRVLGNIFNSSTSGQFFTWIETGDSVAYFKPQYCLQNLANAIGTPGYFLGMSSSSGLTPNLADFGNWPSGITQTFNGSATTGVIGWAPTGTVLSTQCDTFKFGFVTTAVASTNTFKVQSSLNGGTWTDVTNTKLAYNVTPTSQGTVTTGNTTCDTYYAGNPSTFTITGTLTNGSNQLTSPSTVAGVPGAILSGVSGLAANTYAFNFSEATGTPITLSANFTGTTGSYTITVQPLCGAVATVVMGSPGLYRFRVVQQAGTFIGVSGETFLSTSQGLISGGIAQGGIDVGEMGQTTPGILNAIMADANPTVVSFEVKDSPSIFTSYLSGWQTLMGTACPNADFIDIGTTPVLNPSDDALGQSQILKANAATLGHFFFDSYGILGSYRNMATMGNQALIQSALTNSGTTLSLPSGALATESAGYAGLGLILAIWDAGTNPLTNANFEYVMVTAGSGTSYTITRGLDGTTAVAHAQYSNIASGWTIEGIHPKTACNQFLAAQLYQQLGFLGYCNNGANFVGRDTSVPSNINPNYSAATINVGVTSGQNNLVLRQNGAGSVTTTIEAEDVNGNDDIGTRLLLDPTNGVAGFENNLGYTLLVSPSGTTIQGVLNVQWNLSITTAGQGIWIKGGRTLNTAAAFSSGSVTVSDTSLVAGDHISVGIDTPGGTLTGAPYVSSRTNGTGFTISSGSAVPTGDTSTCWYEITHQY